MIIVREHCRGCGCTFIQKGQKRPETYATRIALVTRLPYELRRLIHDFAVDNGVLVMSMRKRTVVFEEEDPETGELCEYPDYVYTPVSTPVCSECFVYGIARSMKYRGQLPYLRNDIGYFMKQRNETLSNEEKKEARERYVIPPSRMYSCEYYRTRKPTESKNLLLISTR